MHPYTLIEWVKVLHKMQDIHLCCSFSLLALGCNIKNVCGWDKICTHLIAFFIWNIGKSIFLWRLPFRLSSAKSVCVCACACVCVCACSCVYFLDIFFPATQNDFMCHEQDKKNVVVMRRTYRFIHTLGKSLFAFILTRCARFSHVVLICHDGGVFQSGAVQTLVQRSSKESG